MVNKGLPFEASAGGLPAERRIALAVTPAPLRPALRALLALDARLGQIVSRTREPLLGQMRLAWWRERLGEAPAAWPTGEPLLTSIAADWRGPVSGLAPLAKAWEELLGEAPLGPEAIRRFAIGRGSAFAAFAEAFDGRASAEAGRAGARWALADFAFRTSSDQERAAAIGLGRALPRVGPLPRALRGVAALDGLAARSLARGEPLFTGRGAALAALRLGMFGR